MIYNRNTLVVRHADGTFSAAGTVGSVLPNTSFPDPLSLAVLTSHSMALPKCITVLAPDEVWDGPANYAAGLLVGDEWQHPRPKRSMTAEEVAAALAARQAAMWEQTKARREEIIYSPIGEIDVRGDGLLRVEPDIRNQSDRDNLTRLHTFAVALAAKGEANAVIAFGDASNDEVMLTPAEMIALAQAVFIRGSLAYQRGRQLRQAIYAENADSVLLDLIDIDAGSIDGVGSWSNPVE